MKRVEIERLREVFGLDPETGVLRWRVKSSSYSRIEVGDLAGSPDSKGYLRVKLDGTRLLAHRVVFAMTHGYWPEYVDHVNGVETDNRPSNLRAANPLENSRNRRKSVANTSGVKGVTWHKRCSKWQATCKVNDRWHHLGLFTDLDAAAASVRAFREQHHGDFARHD